MQFQPTAKPIVSRRNCLFAEYAVIRWHREGFRKYWRRKSCTERGGRPKTDIEIRDLVRRMASENPTYVKRADM